MNPEKMNAYQMKIFLVFWHAVKNTPCRVQVAYDREQVQFKIRLLWEENNILFCSQAIVNAEDMELMIRPEVYLERVANETLENFQRLFAGSKK